MGLIIKQVWGRMGKNWGRMGKYRDFGKVMGGGFIGGFLVV